ncbi:hypothetical protein UlMin_032541 [Ulmus minor]
MEGSRLWLLSTPFEFGIPTPKVVQTPINVISTAASIPLGHLLHRRFEPLLLSYFQKLGHLSYIPRLKESLSSTFWDQFRFFDRGETGKDLGNHGIANSKMTSPSPFTERKWTNVLLALNIAFYLAQIATQGKLMFWGAKINSMVDEGQLWRLVTSSFLHANVGHLLVNCYSLNSVGPSVEKMSGPGRFLAVYFASAIASSTMSYWFCKNPAVGASGAIFGLVGSVAVFVLRHRGQVGGGKRELQHIVQVIALNMIIGLTSQGIDNWGHFGGLLGGAAVSWLLGPAWEYKFSSTQRRNIFVDRAPISFLINRNKRS